jgi:hypothetical protein
MKSVTPPTTARLSRLQTVASRRGAYGADGIHAYSLAHSSSAPRSLRPCLARFSPAESQCRGRRHR